MHTFTGKKNRIYDINIPVNYHSMQHNFIIYQTLASYSCMWLDRIIAGDSRASWAVSEFILSAGTLNFIKVHCGSARASTKMGIKKGHRICRSKHNGVKRRLDIIYGIPQITTNFLWLAYKPQKKIIIIKLSITDLQWSILAVDTLPWHQYCSISHHTQCPMHCLYRFPLSPHLECYLQLIAVH